MAKAVLAGFKFNGMRTVKIQRLQDTLALAQNKKKVDGGVDHRVVIMSNLSLNPDRNQGLPLRGKGCGLLARRYTD